VGESHGLVLFQFRLLGVDNHGADGTRECCSPAHPEQRGAPVTGAFAGRPDGADPAEDGTQNGTTEKKFAQPGAPVVYFNATPRRWEVRKGLLSGGQSDSHIERVTGNEPRRFSMVSAEREDVAAPVSDRDTVLVPVVSRAGLSHPDVERRVLRAPEFRNNGIGDGYTGGFHAVGLLEDTGKIDRHGRNSRHCHSGGTGEGIQLRTVILGGALLALGALAFVLGILSPQSVVALGVRVWPILLFVIAITVVTELAAAAGLFTVVAEHLARWGARRGWLLWIFVVVLATISTVFLSLDTTAVLLTPVVILLARHVGLPAMPFALTTIWLANSASLLLPVSNLTNLLAESRLSGFTPTRFAELMLAPAAVAIVVPTVLIFLFYRRDLSASYEAPPSTRPDDRVLLRASGVVTVALLPLLVSGIAVWIPAVTAALILIVVFAIRSPATLRPGLVPWQLVLFASGLFLVVAAAGSLGLSAALAVVAGSGHDLLGMLRLAGIGAASSNLVNNLPAYLALEPTTGSPLRVAALLIGVNAGPLVTPWASLATLLWSQRLAVLDVQFSWRRFILLGLIAAPITVVLAVLALYFAG
jgi:arsenical pump membrane protein